MALDQCKVFPLPPACRVLLGISSLGVTGRLTVLGLIESGGVFAENHPGAGGFEGIGHNFSTSLRNECYECGILLIIIVFQVPHFDCPGLFFNVYMNK